MGAGPVVNVSRDHQPGPGVSAVLVGGPDRVHREHQLDRGRQEICDRRVPGLPGGPPVSRPLEQVIAAESHHPGRDGEPAGDQRQLKSGHQAKHAATARSFCGSRGRCQDVVSRSISSSTVLMLATARVYGVGVGAAGSPDDVPGGDALQDLEQPGRFRRERLDGVSGRRLAGGLTPR